MIRLRTNDELNAALENDLIIILSKTEGCGVCNAVKDMLFKIKDDYKNVKFYEIYIEDVPLFQGQYLVFTVPTVLIMYQGKEVLRESRFVNIRKITSTLDKILE